MHVLHAEGIRLNGDYRLFVTEQLLVKIAQLTSMVA